MTFTGSADLQGICHAAVCCWGSWSFGICTIEHCIVNSKEFHYALFNSPRPLRPVMYLTARPVMPPSPYHGCQEEHLHRSQCLCRPGQQEAPALQVDTCEPQGSDHLHLQVRNQKKVIGKPSVKQSNIKISCASAIHSSNSQTAACTDCRSLHMFQTWCSALSTAPCDANTRQIEILNGKTSPLLKPRTLTATKVFLRFMHC